LDYLSNVTTAGNCTLTGLPNGSHNLTVYAWDSAGNIEASKTITFTIDKQAESENKTETLTEPNAKTFPTTLIVVVSGASLAVVSVGLLVYFKKRKRKPE
jgi:hypothetical protein